VQLEFIQGSFDLSAFVIKRGQFLGRNLRGVEDGGDQPVDRFTAWHLAEAVVDHPHNDAVVVMAADLELAA